ncbi:FAD-dependent oxidoreductase [Tianweitania sp. BSSL-BM11]|uniref:FAD-dependent oxidoreductase n=1 Tax=Tianweitania aestuarii TaxID=2814886 RepID=A0ABS5S129_9HYPH|nr:FAD-dependent oxidoreductase [Tianweitania aestuarii]MBS9722174.1 FAD-dependent oxidoreductase [Tianweitania aestuarii]
MTSIVIIGAGHAGFNLAHLLRQSGFSGRVVLIGDEGGAPYQRPPLSKAYLMGKVDAEGLTFRPDSFFDEQNIERIDGTATSIDRQAQRVHVEGQQPIAYDMLVLATGARRRELPVEGGTLDGVHGLATRADADRLKQALAGEKHQPLVIGAGFIGLEFAAGARHFGLNVKVIDLAPRIMARAVSPAMSAYFQEAHEQSGVQFLLETGIAHLEGKDGHVTHVVTTHGDRLESDLVVAGIGVIPNDQLARDAGLAVENGIVVDEHLATADPNIFAIGDCANFPDKALASRLRLESVQNATDQARALAAFITSKQRIAYDAVPWFWSDQGSLKLQIAGLSIGSDTFVEQRDDKGLLVFAFRGGQLAAVETANHAGNHMAARKLFGSPLARPSADEIASPGFTLKDYVLRGGRSSV